jgi:hypothetical protein
MVIIMRQFQKVVKSGIPMNFREAIIILSRKTFSYRTFETYINVGQHIAIPLTQWEGVGCREELVPFQLSI